MKTLSQMLEEIEPKETRKELFGHLDAIPMYSHYVDRASYDRMKQVAIELAKACEAIGSDDSFSLRTKDLVYEADSALSRAKDIIGGG